MRCSRTGRTHPVDPRLVQLLIKISKANEGKVVMVVAPDDERAALECLRAHRLGESAAVIGRVTEAVPAVVELVTAAGGRRIVQRPYGEELPRIC